MRKFLNNPKFAAVLAVLAASAVARAVITGLPARDEEGAPAETPTPAAAASANPVSREQRRGLDDALSASAALGSASDPFARGPAGAGASSGVVLRVSALWREGTETLAVINGRIVHPGDVVAGAQVVAGLADGLALEKDGVRQIVPVGGEWRLP